MARFRGRETAFMAKLERYVSIAMLIAISLLLGNLAMARGPSAGTLLLVAVFSVAFWVALAIRLASVFRSKRRVLVLLSAIAFVGLYAPRLFQKRLPTTDAEVLTAIALGCILVAGIVLLGIRTTRATREKDISDRGREK